MHRPTTLTPIDAARRRTEELARTLYEVRIQNGVCFDTDLRREGFSNYEINQYIEEARRIADTWVVRHVGADVSAADPEVVPRRARQASAPGDDEIVPVMVGACVGLDSDGEAVNALLQAGFRAKTIARLWDRFCVAMACHYAKLPRPRFEAAT